MFNPGFKGRQIQTANRKPMKSAYAHKLLRTFLLIGMLSDSFAAHAAHSRIGERGVIQTIDYTNNVFTILGKGKGTESFIWNSGTWFRQKSPKPGASWISRLFSFGEKTTANSLQPGRTVWIYYRREYGRSVAREIVVLRPIPNPSASKDAAHD